MVLWHIKIGKPGFQIAHLNIPHFLPIYGMNMEIVVELVR